MADVKHGPGVGAGALAQDSIDIEGIPVRIFRTQSRKGFWICPQDGRLHRQVEGAMAREMGRLLWNPYRLCYVMPSREGETFYRRWSGDETEEHLQTEGVTLHLFPREKQQFQPEGEGETGEEGEAKARVAPRNDKERIALLQKKAQKLEQLNKTLGELVKKQERQLGEFKQLSRRLLGLRRG